jgi:RNA polymerase sigma factor (TIGR02999 family)
MPGVITENLNRWAPSREASRVRWRALAPLIDRELQRLAMAMLRAYRRSVTPHSIEPAELVNEFYIRLLRDGERTWQDRNHFYSYASAVMRTIMIDRHRAKAAQKRPPGSLRENAVSLRCELEPRQPDCSPVVEVRLAMERLERLSPRQAAIVEWRYFLGLDLETIAARLCLSEKTVRRDLIAARAFLLAELGGSGFHQE